MSLPVALKPNRLLDLLHTDGFVHCASSLDYATVHHPGEKLTLTIPKGNCPLGRRLVTRVLSDAGFLKTDLSLREPERDSGGGAPGTSPSGLTAMQMVERDKIIQMLRSTGGNKLETAKSLGIGRQTLYNKIEDYDIE